MLCYPKKTPNLQELGTVPPIGPLAYQLCFFGFKKRGQLVPNMGKHRAGKLLFLLKANEGKTPPQKKGGFRAKWGGPLGHLTWPLNPPNKNQNNTKKWAFSYQAFLLFWEVQNFPSLTTWPKKRAPPKHYKNMGFSKACLEKNHMRHETAILHQKTNPEIPVIIFFCLFSCQQQNKKCWTP